MTSIMMVFPRFRAGKVAAGRCLVAGLGLAAAVAHASQPATVRPAATEALALCDEAERMLPFERGPVLKRGLDRAEDAVRSDPEDATAHLAVFCNLGRLLQLKRSAGGLFGALGDLARARMEIDTALTLAPDNSAALAAKGMMLIELPRLLGGNEREGRALLARAVAIDPENRRLQLIVSGVTENDGSIPR